MLSRYALILSAVVVFSSPAVAGDRLPGVLIRCYEIETSMHQIPELAPGQSPNLIKVFRTIDLGTGEFRPLHDQFATEVLCFLNIEQPGEYTFRLISDDGSALWIDDQMVINHDGYHGEVPKDGKIELSAGEHALKIWHFEQGGGEALRLTWQQPGAPAANFQQIPPNLLTHDKAVSRETTPGKKKIIPSLRRGLPGDGTPVGGTHPSFDHELLATPMIGMMEPPADCSKLNIQTAPLMHDQDSLILLPTGERSGGKLSHAYLTDLRDPSRQWISADGRVDFEPCAVGYVVANHTRELWRITPDDVDGFLQGCVFRFATGFPEKIRSLDNGIPNAVVAWFDVERSQDSPTQSLCFMRPNERVTFEMYAVRAMTNGFEIEFTKPLDPRCGWEPEAFYVEQWPFDVEHSMTPRRDGVRYPVKSASVSTDRKKIFLEIEDLKPSHVVYIRLLPPCYSEDGERAWSTEAWYTLNAIPQDRHGEVLMPPKPEPQNFLTAEEKAAGWKLLFDGKTTAGWRGYRKDIMPDGWKVKDGCIVRVGSGGDIICEDEFDNFELELEWRICPAGNSGIFYRVNEELDWPFFSGPEMQVLDNAEHADGRNSKTSAGSNYALYAPKRDVTVPIGLFNKARIVCDGPHVEHWLNGEKVVEYELWSDEWKALVAGSKFSAWPKYGLMKKGHIVLQDHGDMVWYRNIKIRER